jgi:hypothetical protein
MSRPSLRQWRHAFDDLDDCPWPGPRPLDATDDHALCGRDEDMKSFLSDVSSSKVIFLTGSSGVGKTSLLRRGIVPTLREQGYVVAVCRDWSGAADAISVADFLEARVSRALQGSLKDLPTDVPVIRTLAQEYGERAVLVLDQFEELIRDARGFTKKLFRALASLVSMSNIKVIISLRVEEMHELRQLEHLLPPFAQVTVVLEEIDDDFIPEVINAGNDRAKEAAGQGFVAITPDAANEIRRLWDLSKITDDLSRGLPPGLLALQGLLYVLDAMPKPGAGRTVTRGLIDKLRSDLMIKGETSDEAASLFARALAQSAKVKLQRCQAASSQLGLDSYMVQGTTAVLAGTVPHLASGGYKLVRNMSELKNLCLPRELKELRRGAGSSRGAGNASDGELTDLQVEALFKVVLESVVAGDEESIDSQGSGPELAGQAPLLDALQADLVDIARAADEELQHIAGTPTAMRWSGRFHEGQSALDADPEGVTSGPMMGCPPALVLMEEFRRFAMAMEWLRASSLVRFNLPMRSVVTVALIHDGFGVALKEWSDEEAKSPSGPLHALTASGQAFEWPTAEGEYLEQFDGASGDGHPRLIVNLRWAGSLFTNTRFRQVQFVNCDLRGALFGACEFEGVSFVNCLLDGLMLSECRIKGAPSDAPEKYRDEASRFVIAGSAHAAKQMAHYKGSPDQLLLSDLPGLPAAPVSAGEHDETLEVEHGSLVIRGGRTASLSVRNVTFVDDEAWFCIRDSAGSGFDIIEHRSTGRYEISGCVLRHVTFSTPPHEESMADPLTITAHGSALYQCWVGDDLQGGLSATDCTLLQIWNGSENVRATATAGCKYHDLIGFEIDADCVPLVEGEVSLTIEQLERIPRGRLVEVSHMMDYRRSLEEELPERRHSPAVGS